MDENLAYYVGFSHFIGIGPMRFSALVKHFNSVKRAYLADKKSLTEVIGTNWAEKFVRFRSLFDPVKKLDELKKKNIKVLPLWHKSYPKLLEQIPDPPICLYVKGDIDKYDFEKDLCFAIVGTRTPTTYGQQVAAKFSEELVEAGFVIVSGMAIGIDSIAHQTALNNDGRTIAFLGCGVDIIYPAVNSNLYHKIINKGGLVISEFPPGEMVVKGLFIARNRLISGLSIGVLIAEGAKDSGAMITARYAAEQGKEVFAPPGPLNSAMSAAPNTLLKQGAKLVTSIDDILDEFNIRVVPKKKEQIEKELSAEEKIVFEILHDQPKLSDEIAIQADASIDKVLNTLSLLEIKGVVEKNSEGKYQIKI
ncbi:DNA protecting protein DprA [Candidatus Roizmanbacteria bacterium RIFCSPLOWO2_01_FULL_37_12]|uniref:DNA protecting protein DprA n=1 Tax=Candidatus Roizmanbacteria bacterium RIFCSPLOWO2_01_FULL_37_12 TaxID=1802056 RepID=A0A1F7IBZ1_9BACT|nr:MAG: DNA protecting protein DprA [Candidatus Roizmanbacteria bacterium RIFCSPHIGHO2_02_FULL_37_9b]OGK40879.1 MAG: DNA protecting protein DprA [Candidatus Roizmanbacteria bacterium RIFCSPLOWO2_01_FULL_37_12]